MTTTELKQRIADRLNCRSALVKDKTVLAACLKHIEELEREVVAHKTNFKDSVESHHRRGGYIDQPQSQLRERDEALSRANALIGSQADANDKLVQSLNAQLSERDADCAEFTMVCEDRDCARRERDEWRKTAGERLDLLTKAEGRALELLERLQKAEAAAKGEAK